MSWYEAGTVTSIAGTNVITGTGTLWNNSIFGIASGQMIFVPGSGQVVIYEILAVDSDTKIRVTKNISSAITNSEYAIVTTVSNSMSDLARRTAVQLAIYQQLLEDWQNITTGTGDVTIIAPDGTEVVIPALSWITDSKTWFDANRELIDNAGEVVAGAETARDQAVAANTAAQAAKTTAVNSATTASTAATTATGAATTATTASGTAVTAKNDAVTARDVAVAAAASVNLGPLGIGLPNQSDIQNFDWQSFAFTSGANYVTGYNTWVNPPAGVTYNAGTRVSIRVIYISNIAAGPRMGLELTPDTGSAANFKVYKLLCVGAAGSRVFTFNQDWNSANPIPISGGGTGANTLAGAQSALGIVADAFGAAQVASTPWNALTLQNGWVVLSAAGYRAAYRKVLGMLQLDISVQNGPTADGTLVATLPEGFRPLVHDIQMLVWGPSSSLSSPPRLVVELNGAIKIYGINSAIFFITTLLPIQ
ncbi:hypothetical protein V2A85_16475 [Yersinia sp. 1252 StPb PI]|uniref:hypothetical protein n=1 Tax=Yersinia sp. 1252 StPb PI TaxID=3117404 RepID=UPI003B2872C8